MSVELTITGLKTFIADYVSQSKIAQSSYTLTNDPITGLTDKIGAQFTVPVAFTNPLKMFDYGAIPAGVDVEEWFDELLLPEAFDNHSGAYTTAMTEDELKPRYPLVDKSYSKSQAPFKFVKTYPINQIKRGFISTAALADFEANFMAGLDASREVAMFVQDKKLVKDYADTLKASAQASTAYILNSVTPTSEATAKVFIKAVKAGILNLTLPSQKFTIGGHVTATNKDNLVLLLNMSIIPSLQVDGRSNSYNLNELEFGVETVPLDDFGEGSASTILAVLVDRQGLRDYLNAEDTLENLNGSGKYKTYFMHGQHTLVVSKFTGGMVWDTAAA